MKTTRPITSLILFFAGLVVLASSIVLLFGPPNHVAHFSEWNFAGLKKGQWNLLHVMSGLLFLIGSMLHTVLNWKPIRAYLRGSRTDTTQCSRTALIALGLSVYVCVGSLYGLPPMRQIAQGLKSVKIDHVRHYGVPPYGKAQQASVEHIARYMGWDVAACMDSLTTKGFQVTSMQESLWDVARNNNATNGAVLAAMHE